MKFLLDHDVSIHVARALKSANYEVVELEEALSRSANDEAVFAKAFELGCVMITCNRDDFLALSAKRPFHGLIVVVRRNPAVLEGRRVLRLLARAGEGGVLGNVNFA
jgi:predicted nuclease of predicted toxin-antitoxin system